MDTMDTEDDYYRELACLQKELRASGSGMTDEEATAHPVQPAMIDMDKNPFFTDTFGCEGHLEWGAGMVVRFMQVDNQWREFTFREFEEFCKNQPDLSWHGHLYDLSRHDWPYDLYCLVNHGWLKSLDDFDANFSLTYGIGPDARFRFSPKFPYRCLEGSQIDLSVAPIYRSLPSRFQKNGSIHVENDNTQYKTVRPYSIWDRINFFLGKKK